MSNVASFPRAEGTVVQVPAARPRRERAPSKPGRPIDPNVPEIGFYKARHGKDRPFVPARVYRLCHCTPMGGEAGDPHVWCDRCDRFPPPVVEVDGVIVDTLEWWPRIAGRPIPEGEFLYMTEYAAWARAHAPHLPEANPRRRIDIAAAPIPF